MKIYLVKDELRVDSFGFEFEYCAVSTYNSRGNALSYSDGLYWWKNIYTSHGQQSSHCGSNGWWKKTFDPMGNVLSYRDSNGYHNEYTYDSSGNQVKLFQ